MEVKITADSEISAEIKSHVEKQWAGYRLNTEQWTEGPVAQQMPGLRIVAMEPPTRKPWVYVTVGASDINHGASYGTEFFLLRSFERHHVELLSLVTYLHRDSAHHLSVGHTMNLGRPWEAKSKCDRLLVSLPYVTGPSFEYLHVSESKHVRFLWIIPITPAEESYRHQLGLDALEKLFEERAIDFVDPKRPSVVT